MGWLPLPGLPNFFTAATRAAAVRLPTTPLAGRKPCDVWNFRTAVLVAQPKWPVRLTL